MRKLGKIRRILKTKQSVKIKMDRGFLNVLILSFGFMLVFTAFQTMGNIEKTVLESIAQEDSSFHGDGYFSLAIIYASLALANWIAPSFISVTGPRCAIVTGCSCYVFFIATFLWPRTELLYIASAILGVGAALAWTGHGQFLTINSSSETMTRNSSVFWVIFQISYLVGNLFVFFAFKSNGTDKKGSDNNINADSRARVFKVLTAISAVGLIVLTTLRKPPRAHSLGPEEGVSSADKELNIPEQPKERPMVAALRALKDAFKLLFTAKMSLLFLTFIYTGLVLTFFSGVYSSCIGFTKALGDIRISLIGLSGILIGVGEIIGGALFGLLATKFAPSAGWKIVVIGAFIHTITFIGILINLPNDAPFKNTDSMGFISPSQTLAMIGSFALGLGDACYNTQVYSILGTIYSNNSAPAFALFKFCQSLAAACSFVYSNHLGLYWQLAILFISLVLGTFSFCIVEINYRRSRRINECPEVDSIPVNTALHYDN